MIFFQINTDIQTTEIGVYVSYQVVNTLLTYIIILGYSQRLPEQTRAIILCLFAYNLSY